MAHSYEFEFTESFFFENTAGNAASFQPRLLLHAYQLAAARGFPELLISSFYFFREDEQERKLTIECDILDITDDNIAIECYLYKNAPASFIAKSFFIFTKNRDI